MPLTQDPDDGSFSNVAYALDTHAATAGEDSLFSEASDFVTKALPLTGLAVVNSFVNTGVMLDNWLGGSSKPVTVEDEVGDGAMDDYYKQHTTAIEAAGLVAGSLIPGTIGVKVFKLAQVGKLSETLQVATKLFSGPKDAIVKGALDSILNPESSMVSSITADKFKAIALGFGDQALQALSYEVAATAAQAGSPLLQQQSYTDLVSNMTFGVLTGGAIGGLLEGVGTSWAFRKAALDAGTATAPSTALGRLSDITQKFLAGDRVATIMTKLPEDGGATSTLGQTKAAANVTSSIMDAKLSLGEITPDAKIASDLVDGMLTARKNGVTPEQQYQMFGRLAKVARITDDAIQPPGDVVYVNRFAKADAASFGELVTSQPSAEAKFAQAYRVAPNATEMKIGRWDQQLDTSAFDPSLPATPLYKNSQEAFEAGQDLFINKDNSIIVNPASESLVKLPRPGESRILTQAEERIRAQTGQVPPDVLGGQLKIGQPLQIGADAQNANAPVLLNLKTFDVVSSAEPVVGDHGSVQLTSNGLKYGDNFSPQSLTPPTGPVSTIDANARFVWAAQRGIKAGDAIAGNDLPMLEQLYKEGSTAPDFGKFIADKRISITGEEAPATFQSPQDLLSYIKQQKISLIAKLKTDNPSLTADQLSLQANVPPSFMQNAGVANTTAKDLIVDPSTYTSANTVKLWYNIGNIQTNEGNIVGGEIDHAYRVQQIMDVVHTNLADFSSKSGISDYTRLLFQGSSSDATPLGVKQTFLGATSADYNSLGQQAERIGRNFVGMRTDKGKQIGDILSPSIAALRADPQAGAEASLFTAVRQRTSQIYKPLPDDIAAANFPNLQPGEKVAVLRDSLQMDKDTQQLTWQRDFLPDGFTSGDGSATGVKGNYNYYTLSPKVAAFEDATSAVVEARITANQNWRAANGLRPSNIDPGAYYAPPIDTTKYRYFAMIKPIEGLGGADDTPGMIVAQNPAQLQQKIASIPTDQFSVWTKDLLAKNHQVLGDYDYTRAFGENRVNSELARRGILSDIYPDTNVESLISNHIDWHTRAESRLLRDHIESGNGQLFAELDAIGQQWDAINKSTFGQASTGFNPYTSYRQTALGLSQTDNYKPWALANEKVQAFFDTAFHVARQTFTAASKGVISFEDAVATAKKFGLGDVYGEGVDALRNYSNLANRLPPQRYLSNFIATASAAMNNTVIRLDAWQQLVHTMTMPIMTMAELASADASPTAAAASASLISTELPALAATAAGAPATAAGRSIPALSKLLFSAVGNLFDSATMDKWKPIYAAIGALRNPESELIARQMRNDMALPFGQAWTQEGLAAKTKNIIAAAGKLSNWNEFVTSFVTADAARQLFEAKGFTGQALTDNILTFVNRVRGNNIASQRPLAFQGPIGQAIGLFQTYGLNVMQNLYRYVGQGDGKALALGAGLQTSLFGFGSLPGFQILNNHIIGNATGNTSHADIYTTAPGYFGKKIANYLIYGSASNVLNASLYTRGDLTPHSPTLLPYNPLDFPIISGGIRVYNALYDTAARIAQGASVPSSLLLGLEHNGLSRPLAGLAQLAQGFSTTAEGKLQGAAWPQASFNPLGSSTLGWNDLYNAGVFSRLLGSRPLDEAVAMDQVYRSGMYKAKDDARIQQLGAAVKTTLYGNQSPSSDDIQAFASSYAASGGRIGEFGRHMIDWTSQANSAVANRTFSQIETPMNKQMMTIMGGVPLPDWRMGAGRPAAAATGTE